MQNWNDVIDDISTLANTKHVVYQYDNWIKFCWYNSKSTIGTLEQGVKICSELTIETSERRRWLYSGVFIVNFEHILHRALVFLLLTLNDVGFVSNIWSTLLMSMRTFETVSIFYWNKARNFIYNRKHMCSHCGIADNALSLYLFQVAMWSTNLMSDVGIDCTLTNLGGNGVNLDSEEGRTLVRFRH